MRFASLIVIVATAASAAQAQYVANKTLTIAGKPIPQTYVVDRAGAPVYASDNGSQTKGKSPVLGDLFFGVKESNGRVLLGKFDRVARKFIAELGWMEAGHLLTNREPVQVGQAVRMNVIGGDIIGRNATAFTRANALDLRVVSKPEAKFEIAPAPGKPGKPGGYQFTWYYVFDIEIVGGTNYYLVGTSQNLFDGAAVLDTEAESAEVRLLGWIDQKTVKEWCSNLVLEYNCDRAAVAERYTPGQDNAPDPKRAKPALIYEDPKNPNQVMAREPLLEFWGHAFGKTGGPAGPQGGDFKLASFDDVGLDPTLPRLHILEKNDEFYRVATLGSAGGGISQSDIAEMMQKLSNIIGNLRMVDVTFVVDCTGSMTEEIQAVGDWMKKLSEEFADRARRGGGNVKVSYQGRDMEIDGSMDLRIGIVGYQEVAQRKGQGIDGPMGQLFNTWVFLNGRSLQSSIADIDRAIEAMKKSLGGGTEALHDGMLDALNAQEMWRKDAQLRIMIVVADEPGDLGGATQEMVLKAMPLPPAREGNDRSVPGQDDFRRKYTRVYGIYTDAGGFDGFRANLAQVVDTKAEPGQPPPSALFHVPNFQADAAGRQRLIDILYGSIEEAQKSMVARVHGLEQQIFNKRIEQPTTLASAPSAAIMDKLAIAAAIKSAGVSSEEELLKLTTVAFTEGWVQLNQKEHQLPTYRLRATLSRTETDKLSDTMERIANGLDSVLKPQGAGAEPIERDPRREIAKALVKAIAEVSGNTEDVKEDKQLEEKAKELLENLEKNPGKNLRTLVNLQESLPINDEGLLGRPAIEILTMKIEDLIDQSRDIRRKTKCLRNIVNSETAPESFAKIDTHKPSHKVWIYKHPSSGVEFYYVPTVYLP